MKIYSGPAIALVGPSTTTLQRSETVHTDTDSTPDGVSTPDLTLEQDCVLLESAAGEHLCESIANCENPAMLLTALCSIDSAMAELEARKKQAETKVHSLAFAAELFVA